MASQSRRRATKNLSRRERRAGGVARSYTVPAPAPVAPRRSYMVEPAPVDYSAEYRHVRKDLFRILLWASVLIVGMVVLSFLPIL